MDIKVHGPTIQGDEASSNRPDTLLDVALITYCISVGNVVICSCVLLTFKPLGFCAHFTLRICLTCLRANLQPATIRLHLNALKAFGKDLFKTSEKGNIRKKKGEGKFHNICPACAPKSSNRSVWFLRQNSCFLLDVLRKHPDPCSL